MLSDIQIETPEDAEAIERLLDLTFGADRGGRTVYALRQGPSLPTLSFVQRDELGDLAATLRFWDIEVVGRRGIVLGPLAVHPRLQGQGLGKAMIAYGLYEARRQAIDYCVVVGEPGYYGPYGFQPASGYGLILPGPVENRRFQVCELTPGGLEGVSGLIRRPSVETKVSTEDVVSDAASDTGFAPTLRVPR